MSAARKTAPLLAADAIADMLRRVPKHALIAFLSAAGSGLAIHLYALTNKFVNRDEIAGLFASRDRATSGRFLLRALRTLFSDFSLPWVNGLVTILALSLVAALTVSILRVKKPLYAALSGILLLAFPSVCNFLSYMYTVDANMLGLLLGVFGAFLLDRYRLGFLPAAALFALSIGTYQANICFVGALMATRGLVVLLSGERDGRGVFALLCKYVFAFGAGAALYALTSHLVLTAQGAELTDYMGLADAKHAGAHELPVRATVAFSGYFGFLADTSRLMSVRAMPFLHAALLLISGALCLHLALLRFRTSKPQAALSAALFLLLPAAYYSVALFNPQTVHVLMVYSIVFTYLLPFALLEAEAPGPADDAQALRPLHRVAGWGVLLLVACCAFLWGLYANKGYLVLQLKYEDSYSLLNRVVDRVEQQPGYAADVPVAFIGSPSKGGYPPSKAEYLGDFISDMGFGSAADFGFVDDDKHIRYFIRYYLGVNFAEVDEGVLAALENNPVVAAMPVYPDAGSMRLVDGVLVVKFSE